MDRKEKEIRELALFRHCSGADVRWIARHADEIDVPAGRVLVEEGQTLREFVVIVRGSAVGSNGAGDITLAAGAYFGDELVDGSRATKSVETVVPTRLLVFEVRAFRGMLTRIPDVGHVLIANLVERLRSAQSADDSRSLRAVS